MKKNLLFLLSIVFSSASIFGQQPENSGFEDWEDAGTVLDEPVDWSSIKTSDAGSLINNAAPIVWGQSDDAHTGNHSLKLFNVLTIGSIVATGTVTNGRIHADFNPANGFSYTDPADARWHTPLAARPDSVAVWAKYFPEGTDTAQIKVVLHTGEGTLPPTPQNQGNWVAYAQINIYGTYDSWTQFKVPFTYFKQGNPEYVLTIMTAGAGLEPIEGSTVYFDDLEFIYNPSGIKGHNLENSLVYVYDNTLYLSKLPEEYLRNARLELFSLNGSLVVIKDISSTTVSLDDAGMDSGLYLLRISSSAGTYAQKIQLR